MLCLFENFLCYVQEKGQSSNRKVHFCNTTTEDIQPWLAETGLEVTLLTTCPAEISVLQCGVVERRPDLLLKTDSESGTLQFVLRGHVWPWRQHLADWLGGYVSPDGLQTEKGQGAYMRWTPALLPGACNAQSLETSTL